MKKYDYILVGSGLFSGVFAYHAVKAGKKCLVVEKRETVGGNLYCEDMEGIHVHKYGAIFSIPATGKYGSLLTLW